MSNPKYPRLNILINDVDANALGAYRDTIQDTRKLLIKSGDMGLEIPGQSDNGSSQTVDPKLKVKMAFYHPGTGSGKLLKLKSSLPSEAYKYNVLVKERFHFKGRDEWPEERVVAQASIGDTSLSESEMLQKIIKDINAMYKNEPNRRVKAYPLWVITDDDSSDASTVDITIDGTTTSVPSTSGDFDISADINGNSTVNDDVVSINLGNDKHLIMGISENVVSIDAGTDITVEDSYVLFKGTDAKRHFDVEVKSDFAEIYDFAYAKIDASTATTADATFTVYDENKEASVKSVDEATAAAFTTNALAIDDIGAELVSDIVHLATIPESGTGMFIDIPKSSTLEFSGLAINAAGNLPRLDNAFVYSQFAYRKHSGDLDADFRNYSEVPRDTEYCKLTITGIIEDHEALHGASHTSGYKFKYTIFMPYNQIKDGEDNWLTSGDTANNAYNKVPSSATKDFGELIEWWTGSNPMP